MASKLFYYLIVIEWAAIKVLASATVFFISTFLIKSGLEFIWSLIRGKK